MSKIIRVQGQQRLLCKASTGDAWPDEHGYTAWDAATAWSSNATDGTRSTILVASATV
jgi:hypothetical protein